MHYHLFDDYQVWFCVDGTSPSTVHFLIDTRKEVGCAIINIGVNASLGVMYEVLQLASGLVIPTVIILVLQSEVVLLEKEGMPWTRSCEHHWRRNCIRYML